jgi:hypothetical protein
MTSNRRAGDSTRRSRPKAEKGAAVPNGEKVPGNVLAMVRIRNATSNSLSFRLPGRSIHLAPGDSLDVPKAYLETDELKALHRQGAVVVEQISAP